MSQIRRSLPASAHRKRPGNGIVRTWMIFGIASVLLSAFGTSLLADGEGKSAEEESRDAAAERGRVSYRIYCLNCHGEGGLGDGPMAEVLKVAPTDLTRIARREGGRFPEDRVYRAIDGRDQIRSHGRRGMPVWGIGLQEPGRDSDQEGEIRARILDLVAYLATIQDGGASTQDSD